MNHITIRKIALSLASVSFSLLFAVILVVSVSRVNGKAIASAQNSLDNLDFQVVGTDLFIEQLSVYDGPFYEDGSGREVLNTMAVLVRNEGADMILHTWFTLELPSGKYCFEATMIPPFSSVLIPEKNAQKYVSEEIIGCDGWEVKAPEMKALPVMLSNINKMTVRLDNLSACSLSDIKIFHRTYLGEEDIYLGGIAYCTTADYISPYGNIEVLLANFCCEYSKVVYIQ